MIILVLSLALIFSGAALSASPDFKIGDRLPAQVAAGKARVVEWDELMPKDWDPLKQVKALKLDKLKDSDPRAIDAMEQLRKMWNAAPANTALDGAEIRIAGFAVPLDWNRQEAKEFLLVPYFGACVHVPPPPANQIIHVTADKAYKVKGYMDAVWVSGKLGVGRVKTEMGESVYRMRASAVEPYKETKK